MIVRTSRQKSLWRIALPAWLTVWMLAIPLVHVHPEADHRHGAPDHIHGGTVHTVLSSDLACEFAAHDYASVSGSQGQRLLHLIAQPLHALHGLEHPEINLVLASSTQSQAGKAAVADLVVGSNESGLSRSPRARTLTHSFTAPTFLILASGLSSRAPPTI
jgi:hypothetical protein